MKGKFRFDYYYGIEAEQFSFYRIPRALIKDGRFKGVSSDAKLLYGLMLDRMAMSMKNGWLDAENRVYIIYTLEDIMEDFNCSKGTGIKILAELDTDKGIGLIERRKRGQGKPTIIYVKNFVSCEDDPNLEGTTFESPEVQNVEVKKSNNWNARSPESELPEVQNAEVKKSNNWKSRGSKSELPEVQNLDFKKSNNWKSRSPETGSQEVQKMDTNYNNNNYNDLSYNNLIYQSEDRKIDKMDLAKEFSIYTEVVKGNIEYDILMQDEFYLNDRQYIDEMLELILETIVIHGDTVRIGEKEYPHELVKSRLLKINYAHIQYVLGCLNRNTTKIRNIRAYLLATLYNAPATMESYYRAEVNHDMYGTT